MHSMLTLTIDHDQTYEILLMRFEVHQGVDDSMGIASPMQWAYLYVEAAMVLDDFLAGWASKASQKYDLTVEHAGENGPVKTMDFKEAVCTELVEMFDDGTDGVRSPGGLQNFVTCLTITAGKVEVKDAKLENF
ncbi:type VI secretion system tube protein TssD [Dyadobacter sandarakinus]|uniref:Uncharacterized protein n=1 Tax=Dyadobacter sandarakinus TaxID=2747268 RepID=A0ABX7IAT2_9BACT|nr:type VI secretion system tube protein TssD [Dyadobacter sandarakinus]QRR03015.1 hypothetical protein HWI92_19930 [Dyadobacter sandarakinus]